MKQILTVTVTCGKCGKASQHLETPGVEGEQPPDLDTRPGEPLRSTLPHWMQCCPYCGYAAADIRSIHDGAVAVVESAAYQQALADPAYPETARKFLAHALILETVHQWADAGWTALHAGWVCDDAGAEEAARRCRARAIDLWRHGKQHGQSFADNLPSECLLAADVYRRMGQFEMAVVTCGEGLDAAGVPPFLTELLRRQKSLVERRDTACHRVIEA